MTSSAAIPEGPGSASGAPNLPYGFAGTFTSRYIDTGDVRLHAVTGGEGPPLLLVHGWPQTWYYWRLVMPALARDFSVVAVDQRGIGLSDKPPDGYDTGTAAADLVALMAALGHPRFAMVGVDTGMAIAYALAVDHPDRLDRLAVGEAVLAGVTPSPPLFGPAAANNAFCRPQRLLLRHRNPANVVEHRRAQLMQPRERQLHLRLHTHHAPHPAPQTRRPPGQVIQQYRLAHARVPAHHQGPALTGPDRADQPIQRVPFAEPVHDPRRAVRPPGIRGHQLGSTPRPSRRAGLERSPGLPPMVQIRPDEP
jgi:pimeloyl-ACP methyl ester carboxylesterase